MKNILIVLVLMLQFCFAQAKGLDIDTSKPQAGKCEESGEVISQKDLLKYEKIMVGDVFVMYACYERNILKIKVIEERIL